MQDSLSLYEASRQQTRNQELQETNPRWKQNPGHDEGVPFRVSNMRDFLSLTIMNTPLAEISVHERNTEVNADPGLLTRQLPFQHHAGHARG